MKTNRTLRLLSLLGFLLLMAPFYDACNGRGMKNVEAEAEVCMDSIVVEKPTIDIKDSIASVSNDTINEVVVENVFEKAYNFVDEEKTISCFEFAYYSIDSIIEIFKTDYSENLKEFKKSKISDIIGFLVYFLFNFIVLISFSILCMSFTKKVKMICKLALMNFIFVLITLLYIIFFDPLFETISQIKWGYYAFAIVQMLIYYSVKTYLFDIKTDTLSY